MFRCWDIGILSSPSVENTSKTSNKHIFTMNNDRNVIWKLASSANYAESEFIGLNNFLSAWGAYYDKYGICMLWTLDSIIVFLLKPIGLVVLEATTACGVMF